MFNVTDLTKEAREELTAELQKELWGEFCDPEGSGVKMEDVLIGAVDVMGADLTASEIQSVVDHYNAPDEWTEQDEEVRDVISDLTDSENVYMLLAWYIYTSGDQAAQQLVNKYKD